MSPDQILVSVEEDLFGRYIVLHGEDEQEKDHFAISGFIVRLKPKSALELLTALQTREWSSIAVEHAVLDTNAGWDFMAYSLYVQENGTVDVDVHVKDGEEWSDYDSGETDGDYLYEREATLGYRDVWAAVIFPLTLALGAVAYDVPLTAAA